MPELLMVAVADGRRNAVGLDLGGCTATPIANNDVVEHVACAAAGELDLAPVVIPGLVCEPSLLVSPPAESSRIEVK